MRMHDEPHAAHAVQEPLASALVTGHQFVLVWVAVRGSTAAVVCCQLVAPNLAMHHARVLALDDVVEMAAAKEWMANVFWAE